MRDFVKVLAWIVFVLSLLTSVLGLISLLVMAGNSPSNADLQTSAMIIGSGLGGLLLSGTSLLVVEVAKRISEGLNVTLTDAERSQMNAIYDKS